MLLDGWGKGSDAFNCLNNYFNNLSEDCRIKNEISRIAEEETSAQNTSLFVEALGHEYDKHPVLKEFIEEVVYRSVSHFAPSDADILTKLQRFHPTNSSQMI